MATLSTDMVKKEEEDKKSMCQNSWSPESNSCPWQCMLMPSIQRIHLWQTRCSKIDSRSEQEDHGFLHSQVELLNKSVTDDEWNMFIDKGMWQTEFMKFSLYKGNNNNTQSGRRTLTWNTSPLHECKENEKLSLLYSKKQLNKQSQEQQQQKGNQEQSTTN